MNSPSLLHELDGLMHYPSLLHDAASKAQKEHLKEKLLEPESSGKDAVKELGNPGGSGEVVDSSVPGLKVH